jgi:hypothetical protein
MELTRQSPYILIAIPSLDYINSLFVESLMNLVEYTRMCGIKFKVRLERGTIVHMAREHLAKYAIENGFTHVFWLDADMVFQPWILKYLFDTGKEFISGVYRGRHGEEHNFTLYEKSEPWTLYKTIPDDIFEIAACGFGCVLMETRLLKEIDELFNACFLPSEGLGEDISFCKRMIIAGNKMYANPEVRLGHIGQCVIEGR